MSYAEDILKLRARVSEAMASGALTESKETLEAVLIQVMNDAERNRQNTTLQAENLRKQAATLDGQAAAFASVVSIVYNVVTGYIKIAERVKDEEIKQEEERQSQKAEVSEEAKKPAKPIKKKSS